MSATTSFWAEIGPLVTGGDIEHSVIDTLRAWGPSYLAEAASLKGMERTDIPTPRGWVRTGRNLQKLNPDQLPCLVVMAGGILAPPRKEGENGTLTGVWGISVGTIFNAAWGDKSRDHAQLYARVIQVLLQQRPLQGLPPSQVDFRGEVYDEIDISDSRSYSASVCAFAVQVRNFAWADGGPPPYVDPPEPDVPWDLYPIVIETEVGVIKVPLDEPLPPE